MERAWLRCHAPAELYRGPVAGVVSAWRLWQQWSPEPVIYWLVDEHWDEVVYVGKSCNFPERIAKHRQRPWWCRVANCYVFVIRCRHAGRPCTDTELETLALAWEAMGITDAEATENILRPIGPV